MVKRTLFLAVMPLVAALTGCAPDFKGIWSITLWEVEGQVTDTVADVGWIEFPERDYEAPTVLMRYFWQTPGGIQYYSTPIVGVVDTSLLEDEATGEWSVTGRWHMDQDIVFTIVQDRDTQMIWEAQDFPVGSLTRWTLEPY